ncbi:hypothetical protein Tco_1346036 [Tanacetum coccineum]
MYLLVGKDDALWPSAQLTKTPIGCTSYKLVYGRHVTLPNRDFPDCEDSHARSIHMSFTSSASFWESRFKRKDIFTSWDLVCCDISQEARNGYLRKGRKTKPKRQNRTRNGKAWKRQSPKAQGPWMAEMKVLKALTEETQERRAET